MRTALDTDILSSLWSDEPSASNIIVALGHARREGAVIASAVVYAEALAHPGITPEFIDNFYYIRHLDRRSLHESCMV